MSSMGLGEDFKNGHQENMCSKEIGLHAQNMLTIIGFILVFTGFHSLFDQDTDTGKKRIP
jgi:hypothetical protein